MLLEDSNIKEKLLKNFIKYFNYFLLLLIIIFFVSSYFIVFKPKQDKIKEIENVRIFEGTEVYDKNFEYLTKIKNFVKKYEDIDDEDKKKINLMLPDQLDYPQLFAQVEDLASNNGFVLSSIIVSPIGKNIRNSNLDKDKQKIPNSINKVSLNITIDGVKNFADYKRMLDMFYNNLLLVDLYSISYSDTTTGSYMIDLTTYFLETEESGIEL